MNDLRAAVREAIEIAEDKQASERGRLAAVHATLTKALADEPEGAADRKYRRGRLATHLRAIREGWSFLRMYRR